MGQCLRKSWKAFLYLVSIVNDILLQSKENTTAVLFYRIEYERLKFDGAKVGYFA